MSESQQPDPTVLVEEAMTALEQIEGRPVEEHPEVFDRVHGELRRALDGGS